MQGFTLIEVLIALMIIAIAMTAIIKATAEDIRTTTYLKNKTASYWVAMNVMNEMRAGAMTLPEDGASLSGDENMLGKTWHYEARLASTANARIHQLRVRVLTVELMAYV